MSTRNTTVQRLVLLCALALAGSGCGSDNKQEEPGADGPNFNADDDGSDSSDGDTGGNDTGGNDTGGNDSTDADGDDTGTDADGDDTGSDNDGDDTGPDDGDDGPIDPGCLDDSGCYKCTPETNDQLLNQCTKLKCVPFDNEARLPLLEDDGSLPALP